MDQFELIATYQEDIILNCKVCNKTIWVSDPNDYGSITLQTAIDTAEKHKTEDFCGNTIEIKEKTNE